jgi:hypothetical protein
MVRKMNPRVEKVRPVDDYRLILKFANGEIRVFDVGPYLNIRIFRELRDQNKFRAVRVFLGSVQWLGGQDFCPDTLYLDSVPLGR